MNFGHCIRLRTLVIGSSILVGRTFRRDHPYFKLWNPVLPYLGKIPDLLPDYLEELTLVVDLEQAARVEDYPKKDVAGNHPA